MFVQQILANKGNEVVTIGPEDKIVDVAALMAEKRVGALVVLGEDSSIAGILSERDIAHGLAKHGAPLLEMTVDQIMTTDVVSCHLEDGIDKLMRKMTAGRFRHVPVLDQGTMVGIVSIGDIVKFRLEELENEASMLQDYIAGAA